MKKILSFLLLSFLLLTCLASCGKTVTDEEAIAIVKERIEQSYPLNDIYFGEGLQTEEYEDNGEAVQYVYVSIDSDYQTVRDLKDATEAVFSEKLCANLYANAFTGFDDGQVIMYARYIEQGGILTANVKYSTIETERSFLLHTVKVIKNTKNYVVFSIERTDGKESTVEITRSADGRWLLNTYTY